MAFCFLGHAIRVLPLRMNSIYYAKLHSCANAKGVGEQQKLIADFGSRYASLIDTPIWGGGDYFR